ncbi:hypothetical protein ASF28_05305 [Methylobacterium sp. Leaf99]|uniref:hypothetical protein n=1 Tax=Methylobacterium sp. Leaf99 TaxID=1736251 RepID=UPI0006F71C6C|nr:hypothetical protein [Methylobacterium sp. Leaf99]KQP10538.1 hypothetical protein ASF28_05305 [Methylobacterium sp. Leaf99]
MSISTITATPAFRGPGAGPAPVQPVTRVAAPEPLAPAVRLDIRIPAPERDAPRPVTDAAATPNEARIRIDRDTRTVVYQEVDPASGDVIVQLPDPVILKARAYAEQAAAARATTEHPLDRTA